MATYNIDKITSPSGDVYKLQDKMSGYSKVSVTPTLTSGTKIGTITVDGTGKDLYYQNAITGVKGNAESSYRTGNVNITPANIGLGNVNNTSDASKQIYEANLLWGGKNFAASYGPIDAAMVGELGANRLMFIKADAITIEYSRDGGTTWTDYGASTWDKQGLFSSGVPFFIGKADSTNKATANGTNYQLQVTINTGVASVYTTLNKFVLYVNTGGSTGSTVTIQKALESSPTSFINHVENIPIEGWSGYNVINVSGITTYGNTPSSQYGRIRFIFKANGGSTNYNGLSVIKIMGFGGVGWTTPSNMAQTGHLYKFDPYQNATFPAQVTATQFNGSLNGNASTATNATSATKATQDESGNNIKANYAASMSISDHTITLKNKNGTSLGTVTVPDNNTTYTFTGGTNKFTVTPSGGTAQDVTVTPSIANNVTGSGTSGYLAKFNGANTITSGPALGTGTTTYLRNDGSWATPTDTTYSAGTGISLSGTTFSNSGVRSIATGSTNGTISVNTGGTSADVAVKGLGSAAYTASTAYAAASHTHSYLPLTGGTISGTLTVNGGPQSINVAASDTSERYIRVNNTKGNILLDVDSSGNHGLYSNTKGGWLLYANTGGNDTDNNLYVPRPLYCSTGRIHANITSGEAQINASNGTHRIYMYCNSNGSSGIYGFKADGTGYSIISTANGAVTSTFNGHATSDLALTGGTVSGSIAISATGKGFNLTDSSGTIYGGLYENGNNLWIGAASSDSPHHRGTNGNTYISAGYNNTNSAGNTTIWIWVPTLSGTTWGGTSYAALHSGNYSNYALPKSGGTLTGTVILNNSIYIYSKDADGTARLLAGMSSANNMLFGYGSRDGSVGATFLDGHVVYIRSNGAINMQCTSASINAALTVTGNIISSTHIGTSSKSSGADGKAGCFLNNSGNLFLTGDTNTGSSIFFYYNKATSNTSKIYESASGTIKVDAYLWGKNASGGSHLVITTVDTDTQKVAYLSTNASALYVNARHGGSSYANKSVTLSSSDIRLKTNIADTKVNALDVINKIRIREFDWIDEHEEKYQPIGMIADEIEKLDKRFAVGGGYDEEGCMNIKSVDTFYLTGYLTKGIQELSKENEELKERIKQLETTLSKISVS